MTVLVAVLLEQEQTGFWTSLDEVEQRWIKPRMAKNKPGDVV
jgi:hypothetical protein